MTGPRFQIPESLLEALRARRTEQQRKRAAARLDRLPTRSPSLIGSIKNMFSAPKTDVERVVDRFVEGMDQLQDEVENQHDAFLLDPGMGPMIYITSDGRVLLDMRSWDGEPMREATEDEGIAALVVGAKKTSIGELLDLIPVRPPDGLQCPMCSGTRWFTFGEGQLVCLLCRGRGWATRERIAKAQADGTWPLREAAPGGTAAKARPTEDELLRDLNGHDQLVVRCARGDLSWADFETAYDSFYPRYPLDGHASDAEELALFEKHAMRIALHREIWDQILTKVTGDERLGQQANVDAGFIGTGEAVRRIQELVRKHLKV